MCIHSFHSLMNSYDFVSLISSFDESILCNLCDQVQAVREVVPGKGNNEVHMVLQYYDYNVETAIQAYLEGGSFFINTFFFLNCCVGNMCLKCYSLCMSTISFLSRSSDYPHCTGESSTGAHISSRVSLSMCYNWLFQSISVNVPVPEYVCQHAAMVVPHNMQERKFQSISVNVWLAVPEYLCQQCWRINDKWYMMLKCVYVFES